MAFYRFLGKYIVLPVVIVAVLVCVLAGFAGAGNSGSSFTHASGKNRLKEMDARAKPYFDKAHYNARHVVARETQFWNSVKMAGRVLKDKVCGTTTAQDHIRSVLDESVLQPCREGARAYGCELDTSAVSQNISGIGSAHNSAALTQTASIAVESAFTAAAANAVRRSAAKTAARCTTGFAVACADGPIPVGDVVGGVIAAAGVATGAADLYKSSKDLPNTLNKALDQAIDECQRSCREAASK